MIPVGYMLKKVICRPDWIKASGVHDLYSVSGCISENFADYIQYWRHNGYWLFDTPAVIEQIARDIELNTDGMTLFYYEAFEEEYDEDAQQWLPFGPEPSFATNVEIPKSARLAGYDVATFSQRNKPECSPLSCNGLAAELTVNPHCLFASFDQARASLEAGKFDNSEPGPLRILAVHTVSF